MGWWASKRGKAVYGADFLKVQRTSRKEIKEEIYVPHTPSAFSDETISIRPVSRSVISDDTTAAAPLIFPNSPRLATHSVSSSLLNGRTNPRSGKAERIS